MAEFIVSGELDGAFWSESVVEGYEAACATAGVVCCQITAARDASAVAPNESAPRSRVEVWSGRGKAMRLRARWELDGGGWLLVVP